MKPITQAILFVSNVFISLAVIILPPRLFGVDILTSGLFGVFILVISQQIMHFFSGTNQDDSAKFRLEKLEDMALVLRGDLERTRREVLKTNTSGTEKNNELVSELKILQTLLGQVMKRESELNTETETQGGLSPHEAEASHSKQIEHSDEIFEDRDEITHKPEISENSSTANDTTQDDDPDEIIVTSENPNAVIDQASEEADTQRDTQQQQMTAQAANRPTRAKGKKAPIRIIKREDQLLSVIRSSLSENRVDLYLQPIVALPARKAVHFECFSRVRDEEGRIVLPRQYMKIAESRGLIGTIDNLLLFRLIQLVRRLGRRRPNMKFFCNLSAFSMADEEFFPQFVDFMASNEEFTSRLVFEISQDDFVKIDDDMKERLKTLVRKGFAFSMDQFVNFDENLTELEHFNFQFIKADARDLTAFAAADDLSEMKAQMRLKGIQLVASRVENEDMIVRMLDEDIEYAQGYLFAEPENANDLSHEL